MSESRKSSKNKKTDTFQNNRNVSGKKMLSALFFSSIPILHLCGLGFADSFHATTALVENRNSHQHFP